VIKDGIWREIESQCCPRFTPIDYLTPLYGEEKFRLLEVTGDVSVIRCLPCLTSPEKVFVICFDMRTTSEAK
ncbi:MAG: hypothetical protein MJA31_14150, partial [Clostridia bacterium]|nr:hypothetical protein [Clostridia bacterium]